ncbi:hypothetical protein PoB_006422000 [Plakobranchus ocellatus]|uniref:Uncharacterized protein n=1 Tax=Plakobranchus ocellatus TaxID=259542 RepID=A0AAV4D0W9_9GAST|nr:hypothetical protein PoB_006422000 [Plakobranchus ocellatus]
MQIYQSEEEKEEEGKEEEEEEEEESKDRTPFSKANWQSWRTKQSHLRMKQTITVEERAEITHTSSDHRTSAIEGHVGKSMAVQFLF